MKKSLIYIDGENSVELIAVNNQIYGENQSLTYGVCINQPVEGFLGEFDYLINVVDKNIESFDQVAITSVIKSLEEEYNFDSILISGTNFGRMLAPRLAMDIGVGLVADVTDINHRNGTLEMVRPAFSGKIMAGITKRGKGPVMMSVRENIFSYTSQSKKNTIVIKHVPKNIDKGRIKLLKSNRKTKSYDIRESEVLISGGGGVVNNFKKLNNLAKELGGQVSASRRIVDSGIAPRSIQVGQSGKTVSPKLYIALGIYGSLQHIEGLRKVDYIISVNTNKNAPICSISDIVVEGDASEFIEKLVFKIKENR